MRVELSPEDTREYKVPVEYRTKADAKSAVVLLAAEQGIVELLRFRGEPAPPGYIAFLATRSKEAINQPRTLKRKDMDEDDGQDSSSRTKRRKGNKSSNRQGDVPFLKSMKGSLAPRHAHALPSRPFASQSISNHTNVIGPWKNSHTPGSGGLGSISVPARAGHPIGQYRSGSRNVSSFATPHRGGAQGSHSGNLSGSHLPDGRLAYGGGQVASYIAAPHRPPSEPFQRSAYPHSVRPEYGIHSSAAGGAVHYPSSHYASPSHALEHNSGYLPPYGTGPVTQTFYPSSQYMGSYQSMALPSYHAQHPSAVYGAAAASQPATPADYAGTSYAYQIPAQHLSHQPPSRETPQTALSTAEALHNDRSFNDSPHITRDSSSEQELGQIDELRRFQDCHQKESSHDVPASHEQKSRQSGV